MDECKPLPRSSLIRCVTRTKVENGSGKLMSCDSANRDIDCIIYQICITTKL